MAIIPAIAQGQTFYATGEQVPNPINANVISGGIGGTPDGSDTTGYCVGSDWWWSVHAVFGDAARFQSEQGARFECWTGGNGYPNGWPNLNAVNINGGRSQFYINRNATPWTEDWYGVDIDPGQVFDNDAFWFETGDPTCGYGVQFIDTCRLVNFSIYQAITPTLTPTPGYTPTATPTPLSSQCYNADPSLDNQSAWITNERVTFSGGRAYLDTSGYIEQFVYIPSGNYILDTVARKSDFSSSAQIQANWGAGGGQTDLSDAWIDYQLPISSTGESNSMIVLNTGESGVAELDYVCIKIRTNPPPGGTPTPAPGPTCSFPTEQCGFLDVSCWVRKVFQVIQWLWCNLLYWLQRIIEAIVGIVSGVAQAISNALTSLWTTYIQPAFNDVLSAIQSILSSLGILDTLTDILNWLSGLVTDILQAIKDALQWLWDTLLEPVVADLQAIFNSIWQWLQDFVSDPLGAIKDALQWFWDNLIQPVIDQLNQWWQWIQDNIITPITQWVGDAWNWIYTNLIAPWFEPAWDWLYNNVLLPIWNLIKDFLADPWGTIQQLLSDFWAWIVEQWNTFWAGITDWWNDTALPFLRDFWDWVYNTLIKPWWDPLYASVIFPVAQFFYDLFKLVEETVNLILDIITDMLNILFAPIDFIIRAISSLQDTIENPAPNLSFTIGDEMSAGVQLVNDILSNTPYYLFAVLILGFLGFMAIRMFVREFSGTVHD